MYKCLILLKIFTLAFFIINILILLKNINSNNNCKMLFQNKNVLKYVDIYELNKSKFLSIKGNANEKSLLSKINSYLIN